MNSGMNEDAIISDLYKSFNQDNVILFVGNGNANITSYLFQNIGRRYCMEK